jgi:hypothetical protein
MLFGALAQLRLKHAAGNGGGMLEYQSAAEIGGSEEDPHATQREKQDHGSLHRSHSPLSQNPPESQDSEYPQRYQRQLLVGFHDAMHRFPVLDVLLGLKSRDDCRGPTDGAEDDGPEAHLPETLLPGRQCHQVEEHSGEEQRGGEIVQGGVKAGPIVTEHLDSKKRER